MCGIAGVVSLNEAETASNLKKMLHSMKHRGPDGAGLMIGNKVEHKDHLDELDFESKKGTIGLGHVRLAITGGMDGLQPFQSQDGKLTLLHNGEIYNYKELRREMGDDADFQTDTDSEVIIRLVEKHYSNNLVDAVKQVLPMLDGVYALAITDQKQTVIARDKIGVRQLYYVKHEGKIFFASEKKPLWELNGTSGEIKRLLPGHVAIIEGDKVHESAFWSPDDIRPSNRIEDKRMAIEIYGQALRTAIQKRVVDKDHVGVIFSGGIDSLLIAYEIQQLGVPFICYTAGREGAPDLEWAKKLAARFNFPLKFKTLSTDDIGKLVPQIIFDIEDTSLNQVEVSVPIYESMRMAQEDGQRVILTGQGADELFGGYPWYATIVDQEGYSSFEKFSWEDTFLLYKECLEREDKISMAHSLELRVPFLDPEVVRIAHEISPALKIDRGDDKLGKHIHRDYCLSRGIPQDIAYRVKEAAQHGANVHDAFEELADRKGITVKDLEEADYDPDKTIREKLGSSSRYGYRYGDHHLWKPLIHVQYYLDQEAQKQGLVPNDVDAYLKQISSKLDVKIIN
ncbi:MAG: asparagine synthase (glutamine-hydrolyzing) [Calditrichaceae bacterium]